MAIRDWQEAQRRDYTLARTTIKLALAALLATIAPATAQTPDERPVVLGTTHQLRSAVLGDLREINVWLPPDYAASRDRYPVVYLLDGALDQDFRHVAGIGELGAVSATFGPFIIVGIQTRQRRAELTSPPTDARYRQAFPDSGGATRFRAFLRREVMPMIERRYRTGDRRALMGESLAGLFVVDTLLDDPTLAQDYVAVSPSLWWDDRRPIARAIARRDLKGTRLYLAVADEGGTMQDGIDRLRGYLGRPESGVTLRYDDRSAGATHATIYHGAAEQALRWLYPAPPYPAYPTPWYMIEGASPPPARRR